MIEEKVAIKNKTILIISGIACGFVNGLFGGGGGMIVVPLLILSMKLSNIKAHATAILVILIISLLSILIYGFNGDINFRIAIPVTIGSILGGILGAKLLNVLPPVLVAYLFIFLMLVAGIRMVI